MSATELYKPEAEVKPRARAEQFLSTDSAWFLFCDEQVCGSTFSAFVAETWVEAINRGPAPFNVNPGGRW